MVLDLPEKVGRGENEDEDEPEESFAAQKERASDAGEEKTQSQGREEEAHGLFVKQADASEEAEGDPMPGDRDRSEDGTDGGSGVKDLAAEREACSGVFQRGSREWAKAEASLHIK